MYSVAKAFAASAAISACAGAGEKLECDVWAQVGGTPVVPQNSFDPIFPLWNTSFMSSNPSNSAIRMDFSYPVVRYMDNGTIVHNYPFYNMGCPPSMVGNEYQELLTCTGYSYTTESFAEVLHNFSTLLNPSVDPTQTYSGFLNVTSENGCEPYPINGNGLVFSTFLNFTAPSEAQTATPT